MTAVVAFKEPARLFLADSDDAPLTDEDGQTLLRLARDSIVRHLEGRALPRIDRPSDALVENRGVFVTVRSSGTLRGCLGRVERSTPLWLGVQEMAVAAASRDRRFSPLEKAELERMRVEISVLSPLLPVTPPGDLPGAIEVGRHGIFLRRGDKTGLLLPQVAVEQGWGAERFLERTCAKAGLPAAAWREGAEVFLFTCQVLEEPEPDPGAGPHGD